MAPFCSVNNVCSLYLWICEDDSLAHRHYSFWNNLKCWGNNGFWWGQIWINRHTYTVSLPSSHTHTLHSVLYYFILVEWFMNVIYHKLNRSLWSGRSSANNLILGLMSLRTFGSDIYDSDMFCKTSIVRIVHLWR